MKMQHLTVILPLAAAIAGVSLPAFAVSGLFSSETEAAQACGADTVVWIDLDKGRFYEKTQDAYSKSKNGVFACMKTAHAQYRPGHD